MTSTAPAFTRPNRRGVVLISTAHLVNDLYQGVVPAMLPFFAAERHYSYAALAGLTLAATLISSIAQPVFGLIGDRRPLRWMIMAGIALAAAGIALTGWTTSYALTWIFIALSGLGIAAFHPEGSRAARQAAGNSNKAMSLFALGGNGGYALGSLVATPVFLTLGVSGAPLLALPAAVMVAVLIRHLGPVLEGERGAPAARAMPTGVDRWWAFTGLIAVIVIRSTMFLAMTSFLGLFFVRHLGTSEGASGAVLTTFLVAGAAGTLLGGWIADRWDRLVSIRIGFAASVPALAGLLVSPNLVIAIGCVIALGIALYLPFSVIIMLGQDYLPNRIGTASGVTVGLPMTIGGLFAPLVGTLADNTSLTVALASLLVLPLVAIAITTFLTDPQTTQ